MIRVENKPDLLRGLTSISIKINFTNIFLITTSLLSFLAIVLNYENITSGYNLVVIFPLIFIGGYIVTLGNLTISNTRYPITIYMFLILQWLRYVLSPLMISLSGENAGTSFLNPQVDSLAIATSLMVLDLIICFLILFYLSRKKKIKNKNSNITLRGNRALYFMFIIFAIIIYLTIGISSNMINFLFISVEGGERVGDITNTPIVIARQIVLIAIFLLFIWVTTICAIKYEKTKNKKYFYIAILFALINVSIIIGERRSAQVYTAFCSIMILFLAFPQFKRKITLSVGGLAVIILVFMSIYKFSAAFIHGSYLEALKNSSFDVAEISQILQSYFAGPQDLATVMEFADIYDVNIQNLIFDFARSTVPISFFVKNMGMITSEMFNLYIYKGLQTTGHVVSALAHGFIYMGVFFSSIFSVLNLFMCCFFEDRMNSTNSYEMMYVWAYILMRFGLNLTANTPALISATTIMLITAGLLFQVSICINKRMR